MDPSCHRAYSAQRFSVLSERKDRGELFENYVYLRLKQSAGEEMVKYWRTQNRQDVDFVVQRDDGTAAAYEVKWRADSFRPSKYNFFRQAYPEISLNCISTANAFELNLSSET